MGEALVDTHLQYQHGSFTSKSSSSETYCYDYHQTIRKTNFYLNDRNTPSGPPLLYERNYLMVSALRMPAVIECMTAELMGLVREEEKAYLGLVEQLKEELEKVRPFKVYGEVDLMVEKLEVKELKILLKEGRRNVKVEKMVEI